MQPNLMKLMSEYRALQEQIGAVQVKFQRVMDKKDSMDKELAKIVAENNEEIDSTLECLKKPKA